MATSSFDLQTDRTIDGPCFCDRLDVEVCRLKAITVEPTRTVKWIQCDECGLRFRRIEWKFASEFDADALLS